MPNILGHAWPPDVLLKGFNGLLHAKVALEGTAVHLFQEQLPEAMVGQDDELEKKSIGESDTGGTSYAPCACRTHHQQRQHMQDIIARLHLLTNLTQHLKTIQARKPRQSNEG